jgi:phosphoribosylformylglycinamidine cyclo-ligase
VKGGRPRIVRGMDAPSLNQPPSRASTYKATGVDTAEEELGMQKVVEWASQTFSYCGSATVKLPIGYFANVLQITPDIGIAISTDGVGTKILVAEQLNRFDTIGIDCIAMNANDVLCVGARPISMVDYIAVQRLRPEFLAEVGVGLQEGARQAEISIPGGEIAQVPEMVRGVREGGGIDLVGTCIGLVHPEQINTGRNVKPGDVVIGLPSSGLHSNGFTLARKALLDRGGMSLGDFLPGVGRTLGEELLEPTRIYVKAVFQLMDNGVEPTALIHVTSDGFLNLARVQAPVGFRLDQVPQPAPIFELIQQKGRISAPEMYTVFNMGTGFCVVVNPSEADRALELLRNAGEKPFVIGQATDDKAKTVTLTKQRLRGTDDTFESF